ncbi:unnamed protein product [Brachionus calyciflorus]|uniref:Snake toxin/toxin-like domain-containing protein n=1 Tax=Brachionus calyciflorus TaxID=104777 RepID=A0A813XKR2_9BILA|nr:unnamed protein product [Brachionus calyciflorus]
MNKSIFFILSISIALFTFPIQKANALKCYSGGAGVFASITCPEGSQFCQKMDTAGVITKTCTSSCLSSVSGLITTSCCSTDNCNSSTSIISSSLILAFSLVSAIWLKLN